MWHLSRVSSSQFQRAHVHGSNSNKTLGNHSTDLFSWNGSNYLLMVNYYSRFIELAKLSNNKSQSLRSHLCKTWNSKHCTKWQWTSVLYSQFSKDWGFTHATTSPCHSQSNGLAEKSVQIVKRLLNKATNDGTDPYLGLFECRNTPIDNIGSPAQLSMSHHLRSVMPATRQVKPTVIEPDVVMERLN